MEKKIKRLEAEKEILNRAIDIADDTLGTEIRRKYLLLSLEASNKKEDKEDQESELPLHWVIPGRKNNQQLQT